ncbi:MAG TPA: translation initiation factor IF-2 [Candidatus Thermoplasmatota archaeon]|nr:translation initiation factor IF-2 [Candidatus Thermoplasmatota archaeon]
MVTRQPIVSILGHVDHGKTSLLDKIRGTGVASRESGGITQHIGASEMPLDSIRDICGPLMKGKNFSVPGLLFIDTPGHHAFSTLRARGGALADIAVLVVDITEGFKPQTKEALSILRKNRTPFVVAANKVDKIHNWQSAPGGIFSLNVKNQTPAVIGRLEDAVYTVIGQLTENGISSADRIDRVTDFTKAVAVVPCSAHTGEGIPELLLTLVGLAQKFLEKDLATNLEAPARGTVLEVKDERGLGLTIDAIIYDGHIRAGDTVVIGALGEPKVTRVKGLFKPKPKDEMRDHREPFSPVKEVVAAAGVKLLAQDLEGVLAGAPLVVASPETLEDIKRELASEVTINIQTEEKGVFIKADTLGSLEALASECRDKKIPISRAAVGDLSRRDVIDAQNIQDPLRKVVLAFNVKILPDAKDMLANKETDVPLFHSDIIYHLLDEYEAWIKSKTVDLDATRRLNHTFPGKFNILPNHVFRMAKPAIVGVRILGGRIRTGQKILRDDGRVVGEIKSIRRGEETVPEAKSGEEVAIAIDDVTIGRQMEVGPVYYIDMTAGDAKMFRREHADWLNFDEKEILQQISAIKQKEDRFWGM